MNRRYKPGNRKLAEQTLGAETCLMLCCRELRAGNKIDATELRLEDGLFKSFDEIIRRQLDAVWHTVSYKTKQVFPWTGLPNADEVSQQKSANGRISVGAYTCTQLVVSSKRGHGQSSHCSV